VLHHVTLWVPDLARAEQSWSWLLGLLGYQRDNVPDTKLLFRHPGGLAIVLEESTDMVPGMLYSRMRPGLNHLAFTLESDAVMDQITGGAQERGWTQLPVDGHPIAGGAHVVFLEDRDGFEVELVVPTPH
jgi:catechol 2,3-dioxygenase-like lactoylglutathione lyase family enzyme